MHPSKFEEQVKKHVESLKKLGTENAADWDERRRWWQQKVTQLLDIIDKWLGPLIQDKTVTFTRSTDSITEEALGEYEVQSGLVQLGTKQLHLRPVASVIIGGFGRIDVDGPNGSVMFILSAPDPHAPRHLLRDSAAWFISHPKQRRELRPLTKETFEQLFTDLFGIDG